MASLPYPRSLLTVILSHRFHRSAQNLLAVISSHRIHRIHRTFSLWYSPTDSTDLHRCRRVWHPAVPTHPLTQPTICVDQCNLWENCIPTERTEPTEASCREGSPTDITDLHRCRRVWHPAVPRQPLTQPNFCEFCEFRGRTNATNQLCWFV